jgi:tetratricopeptide (TPR) repeat protein
MRWLTVVTVLLCLAAWAPAQTQEPEKAPGQSQPPPRSDRNREAGESSSRDSRIDISPPKDDAKEHPFSQSSVADAEDDAAGDVQEFHPWDPHKAAKDIEVGDFYLKRKNYRAALDRYQEALEYKPNDAIANFRLGQCFEKLNQFEEAGKHYGEYLKILPQGALAEEAQKALDRLKRSESDQSAVKNPAK